MVEYKCPNCEAIFDRKSSYENHINRKVPCAKGKRVTKLNKCECEHCSKKFSRKDVLIKHLRICKKAVNNDAGRDINNIDNNVRGDNVQLIGDNGQIVIKNYNLFPFGKDGIDCLTTPEKIAIFSSDENPMEMIIVKVNLHPDRLEHHNVGIPNIQSGYGIIFDGDQWMAERINVIMDVLLNSKEKDLIKIYNEIKEFLSGDMSNNIKNKLDDINNKLNCCTKIDIQAKKTLVAHLKKHLYNNRNLAIEAKKRTEGQTKIFAEKNIDYTGILKDGMTIEELDKQLKLKKKMEMRIVTAKEICTYLLKIFGKDHIDDCQKIMNRIEETNDLDVINIIIRNIVKSVYFGERINDKIIDKKIIKQKEIDEIIFGTN